MPFRELLRECPGIPRVAPRTAFSLRERVFKIGVPRFLKNGTCFAGPPVSPVKITTKNTQERRKHRNIKKYPEIPQLGSHPKILYVGFLSLENKGEEASPPHRELGLSNLYAGDPFNSLCGYSLCAFFAP